MTTTAIKSVSELNKEQLNELFSELNSACDYGFQEITDAIQHTLRGYVKGLIGDDDDERIDALVDEIWELVEIPNIKLEGAD